MPHEISVYPLKMKMPPDGNPSAVNLPLMAALVEIDHHLILIDTGFPQQSDLIEQLSLLHFEPGDVTSIINTHAHIDHIGGNRLFPRARIVVSKTDYEFAKSFSHAMQRAQSPAAVLLQYFPHSNSRRIEQAAQHACSLAQKFWREDLIGDADAIQWAEDNPALPAEIKLLPTPGHTPGHLSVIVSGRSEQLTVAGDAMPSRLFWKRRLRELAPRFSSSQFQQSKAKIERQRGIILGGHDRPFRAADMNYVDKVRIIL